MPKESILSDLKKFEAAQKQRVEKARENTLAKLEKAKKDAELQIGKEQEKLRKEKNEALLKAKENALKSAKGIFDTYRERQVKLEQQYKKNFNKAVDAVLADLLK